MVDYENPYQKKVVAPSNVFCFITQIKTTLLKKLGIIFIFRKKEKKMRPPRPTKRHKNTTKDQASVPSQCHDEPFGNPPPTSPRSVHHAPLELSGVSLKGHEGAAPHGDFSWKKTHWFPKEIQHKSPLSKKKTDRDLSCQHRPKFFLGKKKQTPTSSPISWTYSSCTCNQQKHLKELQKFCPKVAEVAYRALLLLLLYHISSTVIQNRPTSFLPSRRFIMCVFEGSAKLHKHLLTSCCFEAYSY